MAIGGTAADRLGLRLHGVAAIVLVVALAGSGWVAATRRSDRPATATPGD
jgi:hypothetical protein